jgi:hypothetical protein
MKEIKYLIREVGGMHSEWENVIGEVVGIKNVIELLREKIGSDEMDGDNWVESINRVSDWEMLFGEFMWGNECFEVVKVG